MMFPISIYETSNGVSGESELKFVANMATNWISGAV